jgi:hypothetical protein
MLISDFYRGCVVFLSQENDSGTLIPRGTGFLVADPASQGATADVVHLVTARHVVEAARATGKPLFVRGTSVNSGIALSPVLSFDAWHISDKTDVAIFRDAPLGGFGGSCLTLNIFADGAYLESERVGPGDEVFFAGLFTGHAGSAHNEPIVRFGNISMMPREPVEIKNADGSRARVRAFLVEARSWGGQSGSPAFVWMSPLRNPGFITMPMSEGPGKPLPLSAQPRLLGLVCGHFDVSSDIAFEGEGSKGATVRMNAGVAIVIPSTDIATEFELALANDRN